MSDHLRRTIDELDAKACALEAEAERLRSIADPLRSLLAETEPKAKPKCNSDVQTKTPKQPRKAKLQPSAVGSTKGGCIDALAKGPLTTKEIATKSGLKQTRISVCLSSYKDTFRKAGGGKWELVGGKVSDPDAGRFNPVGSSIEQMNFTAPMKTSNLKITVRSIVAQLPTDAEFTRDQMKDTLIQQVEAFRDWGTKENSNLASCLVDMVGDAELTRRGYGTLAVYRRGPNLPTPKATDPDTAKISVPREP